MGTAIYELELGDSSPITSQRFLFISLLNDLLTRSHISPFSLYKMGLKLKSTSLFEQTIFPLVESTRHVQLVGHMVHYADLIDPS